MFKFLGSRNINSYETSLSVKKMKMDLFLCCLEFIYFYEHLTILFIFIKIWSSQRKPVNTKKLNKEIYSVGQLYIHSFFYICFETLLVYRGVKNTIQEYTYRTLWLLCKPKTLLLYITISSDLCKFECFREKS